MSETNDTADKTLRTERKPLSLKRTVESGHVRQSFSHGRSKSVVVEKRRSAPSMRRARPKIAPPTRCANGRRDRTAHFAGGWPPVPGPCPPTRWMRAAARACRARARRGRSAGARGVLQLLKPLGPRPSLKSRRHPRRPPKSLRGAERSKPSNQRPQSRPQRLLPRTPAAPAVPPKPAPAPRSPDRACTTRCACSVNPSAPARAPERPSTCRASCCAAAMIRVVRP